MTILDHHRRLFRNSILLALGHGAGMALAIWGAWHLSGLGMISTLLWFLSFAFGNALRFHFSEARKLSWLIAVDRINANLYRHSKP